MYVLYALMLQVGIGIGCNRQLKELIKSLRFKMLLVPVATITGTLLFSAFASLLLTQWSVFDCMAVGSGFAYYSLSSILITQFKEPSMGLQLATELGTIALLANIFREMMALLGAPLIRKYFGRLAPISAAGVNSMDVLLPSITRYSGKDMIPIAIFHGILIDMSVPEVCHPFYHGRNDRTTHQYRCLYQPDFRNHSPDGGMGTAWHGHQYGNDYLLKRSADVYGIYGYGKCFLHHQRRNVF